MNFQEQLRELQALAEAQATVRFTKVIEDQEDYAECSMMARILRVKDDLDDIVKITFDFLPFESHNEAHESANYWDPDGKPRWTARQAGLYQPISDYYLSEDWRQYFEVIDNEFIEEYFENGKGMSYVEWLESELSSMRHKYASEMSERI